MLRTLVIALALGTTTGVLAGAPAKPFPAERAERAAQAQLSRVVPAGDRLVAVGARGHILSSADGVAWEQVDSPVNVLLTSVYFVDARRGWAVGHDATILHTADGGRRWSLQHFRPDLNLPLLDVLFTTPERGVAVGAYGLVLVTADGGATWTRQESPLSEEGLHFNALARLGDGSLLVVGEQGMLALSADEGQSWSRLTSPYGSSLFAVAATGAQGAMIGGLRGNLFRSDDVRAGAWQPVSTREGQSIFGMAPLPDGRLGMVGLNTYLQVVDAQGQTEPPAWSLAASRSRMELGSLSHLVHWRGQLVSVGEAGVVLWKRAEPR